MGGGRPGEKEMQMLPIMGSLHHTNYLPGTNYDDANIDFSSHHDISAIWKLSKKIDPEGANSTYTTNYPMY